MSALSEQCEVLRLWAKHLREGEPILASDLREAADTILDLRDMAQRRGSCRFVDSWSIQRLMHARKMAIYQRYAGK